MAVNINIPSQVSQTITDGVTDKAPSEDAVHDALSLKANSADLGNYVPYTGANNDVDLGTYNITADHINLNVSPSGAGFVVGSTQWNNTIGSSETLLKGGNVTLKNGVDLVARVVNKVTPNTTLTKAAYQAVRVSGAQGGRLAVALAQANNDNNSADTIGLVTETIATNQEGFIITVGQIENINTTGSLQGETWTDGDVLYLSPTVAGKLTNIKPTGATGHIVVIGYVEYAHANNGKIYVKVMNGWELDELHNVSISSVANNDLLQYDSASSLWKNESLSTAGIQPTLVSGTSIKTINGTTLLGSGDITVGGGITVGTTAVTSGTVGRVFFQGTGNIVQQDSALFWDNTNKRLGVGANATAPSSVLFVRSNTSAAHDVVTLQNGQYGDHLFRVRDNATASPSSTCSIFIGGRLYGGNTITSGRDFDLGGFGLGTSYGENSSNAVWLNNQGNIGDLSGSSVISVTSNVYINNQVTKKYKFETVSGHFGIGNVGTLGARLDVRAQGALSTDIAFRVRNSADTANIISISGNGQFAIGLSASTAAATAVTIGGTASTASATSVAIGYGANTGVSSDSSMSVGYAASATGYRGVALGFLTNVTGTQGISLGERAAVTATNSIAIGSAANVSASGAFVVGANASNAIANSNAFSNGSINGYSFFNDINSNYIINSSIIPVNNISYINTTKNVLYLGTGIKPSSNVKNGVQIYTNYRTISQASSTVGATCTGIANSKTLTFSSGTNMSALTVGTRLIITNNGGEQTHANIVSVVGLVVTIDTALVNINSQTISATATSVSNSTVVIVSDFHQETRNDQGDIIKLYKQSSSGITTVAQLVTVLQNLGLLS